MKDIILPRSTGISDLNRKPVPTASTQLVTHHHNHWSCSKAPIFLFELLLRTVLVEFLTQQLPKFLSTLPAISTRMGQYCN